MRVMILALLALLMIAPAKFAQAQDGVTVLCDEDFDFSEIRLPDPFPGVYYYEVEDDGVYQFGRVTHDGTTIIQAPLTADQTEKYFSPIVSPDGKIIAFRPVGSTNPVLVWNIETNEAATLMLSHDEGNYLIQELSDADLSWNKMIWYDNSTLVVRFYDDWEGLSKVVAQTSIKVSRDPLQLSLIEYTEFNDSDFSIPDNHRSPHFYLSPQGTYGSVISYTNVPAEGPASSLQHLQMYALDQGVMIFDLYPTEHTSVAGSPIWMPDEAFFIFVNFNLLENRRTISVVNVSDTAITLVPNIWNRLNSSLGTDIDLSINYHPSISPDGTLIAFGVTNPAQGMAYHVIYNPYTDQITAICDKSNFVRLNFVYPIWGLDEQYFGLWKNGAVIMFDTTTGEAYRLPNPNNNDNDYVGWVSDDE